ncbi:glycosyltransferase [Emticicia fluvialis]|uniref:glycosyltransferase n=1 Tax=Emticicia fluvialis TaxID=2974474 RepID=UPI002165794D|nr:nucleotide disphospho-sugar-binding domain-containing protein [Emticicia fluvialis]
MRNVVFIMLPYPSHYTNSFSYAQAWQNKGYNVVYAGLAPQKDLVQKQGFQFQEISYSVEHPVKTVRAFAGILLKSIFSKENAEIRFNAWQSSIKSALSFIEKYQPYATFIDAHLTYLYFYLSPVTPNIAILNTKLSTQKSAGIPPLNSSFIPSGSVFSRCYCEVLWASHLFRRRAQAFIKAAAYLRKDRNRFLYNWARETGTLKLIDKKNGLFNSVSEIPRVILGLQHLEFAHKRTFSNEYYVNLPVKRDESRAISDHYMALRQQVIDLKKQSSTRVIYVSFGTIGQSEIKHIATFLNSLFMIGKKYPQWFFMISLVGIRTSPPALENVKILPFVPQLDFLKYADAMITHGGMGSIKECVQSGVPMLVYPLDKKMDQPGNGARVQAKGLGLAGNIAKDTMPVIELKLKKVFEMKYKPIISSTDVEVDIFS